MSMTLILWKAPLVPDACAAEVLLRRWYKRGDDRELEPSESIAAFADELLRRYPPSQLPQDAQNPVRSPWAEFPFVQTGRIIELDLDGGAGPHVIDDICALAREHELLIYDPQSGDVCLPGDPVEAGKVPPPRTMDWVRATAMAAAIAMATCLAWLIPIGWLRWPLLAVGAFFTAAALFVMFAMAAGVLGMLDERPRDASLP